MKIVSLLRSSTSIRRLCRPAAVVMATVTLVALAVSPPQPSAANASPIYTTAADRGSAVPVLAYYYIWYDPTSWNRAKTDVPLAGKYSSDERTVMADHIRTAQAAGVDGFIVSWKRTEKLDRRLAMLADVAELSDFKLAVIYEGLDFEREPLPATRVASDLDHFLDAFAFRPAFQLFEKPAVILSGSWRFSADEINTIGGTRRSRLLLLGSEKDTDGIDRLAGLIDGDAYYWSSVNPRTQPKYQERLDSMSVAVHREGGLWIAPAAPGFDARLVGGTTVVERSDGATLEREYAAAVASEPDAVGLISWNEFSENSHLEPSRNYGTTYVEKLAKILGGTPPRDAVDGDDSIDSSEPGGRGSGLGQLLAFTMVIAIVAVAIVVAHRRRQLNRAHVR